MKKKVLRVDPPLNGDHRLFLMQVSFQTHYWTIRDRLELGAAGPWARTEWRLDTRHSHSDWVVQGERVIRLAEAGRTERVA